MSYQNGIKFLDGISPVTMNQFGEFYQKDSRTWIWNTKYKKPDAKPSSVINNFKALRERLVSRARPVFCFNALMREIEV